MKGKVYGQQKSLVMLVALSVNLYSLDSDLALMHHALYVLSFLCHIFVLRH